MVEKKYAVLGGACCAIVITSVVLIAVSFATLDTNEVGLDYSEVNLEIDDSKLYTNGRHFLGVGHKFFKYPARLQPVSFTAGSGDGGTIAARTREGLELELAVSFNFKLVEAVDDIVALYLEIGEMPAVKQTYLRIARNWIRSVASNYSAFSFFFNRSVIAADMETTLDRELGQVHATIDQLQLLDVDLPTAFEQARERQSAAFEEINTAEAQAVVAEQEARDGVTAASSSLQILTLEAESTALELLERANATAAALQQRYTAETSSLTNLKTALGLSQTELLEFVWNDAVKDADGLTVNLPTPAKLSF